MCTALFEVFSALLEDFTHACYPNVYETFHPFLPPLPPALPSPPPGERTYWVVVGSHSSRIPPVRDTDTHTPCWNKTGSQTHPGDGSMAGKKVIKRKSVKNKEKQILAIFSSLED